MELMAVLLIVGMALGMVTVAIGHGGPEKQLYDKLDQMMVQSDFASEHAVVSGEALGLLLQPPEWQVEAKDDINDIGWRFRWQKLGVRGWEDIPTMEAVSFEPDVDIEVTLGGKRWDWRKLTDHTLPIVAISPSGEITPFVMELRLKESRDFSQHIELSKEGDIVWREAAKDDEARKKR